MADLTAWALPQLSRLLPLDDDSLKQIITYSEGLSNREAADHLQNLLGDTPQALEFITSFNNRRAPKSSQTQHRQPAEDLSEVPKAKPRKKKAAGLGKLPSPRQPENYGNVSGGYVKKEEGDYMAGSSKPRKANNFALQERPDAIQAPTSTSSRSASPMPLVPTVVPKAPPSAAGPLISDKLSSRSSSRNASPSPRKAKINVSGGTSMHGASSTINDLDSAIRALEVQTNPTLSSNEDNAKRKCNCTATRHPLLEAAPNCLQCGKIVCVKEGIGPCTFCNTPLLSSSEIQSMVRVLREERGKERMAVNNSGQKRAEVSKAPRPFATPSDTPVSSAPPSDSESEKLSKAKQHRDRLLAFQAQNARRTQVHDEAADFETPTSGLSMWASPQERALQLKRQQKILREQEWNARPEYDKRKVVASIDLVGGKIVKRMAAVERPRTPESEEDFPEPAAVGESKQGAGGGAFSKNPLLGSLIRPVAKVDPKGKGTERRKQTWRRVQDDNDDNEQWILDGGLYGSKVGSMDQDGCG